MFFVHMCNCFPRQQFTNLLDYNYNLSDIPEFINYITIFFCSLDYVSFRIKYFVYLAIVLSTANFPNVLTDP